MFNAVFFFKFTLLKNLRFYFLLFQVTLGQRLRISSIDADQMNRLYKRECKGGGGGGGNLGSGVLFFFSSHLVIGCYADGFQFLAAE